MKRQTSTVPTKIYTYSCRPPIDGQAQLEDQLRRAHCYRNVLVEIERRRRERIQAVQAAHDSFGPLLRVIAYLEEVIEEARQTAKRSRAGKGDKAVLALMRERVAEAKADLSVLRVLRAASKWSLRVEECPEVDLCEEAKASPFLTAYVRPWQRLGQAVYADRVGGAGWKLACEYAIVSDLAASEQRHARGESGLTSGTYLAVEKAAEAWRKVAEPPRFERYQGEGRVAVQIQGGVTTAELLGGEDTRVQLLDGGHIVAPVNPTSKRQIARAIAYGIVHFCRCGNMHATPRRHGSGSHSEGEYKTVRLRVGSDGRAPVWVVLPIYLSRVIPDGVIKNAWVIRRKIGLRYRYDFQFTIESESFIAPTMTRSGVLAVDVGARDLPTGQVRAAMWLDGAGGSGELVGQLMRRVSPTRRVAGRRMVPDDLRKVTDLQSIRSKHLDDARDALVLYRASLPDAPEWLQERTRHADKWRSPGRLGALVRDWQRHDGDEEIYTRLCSYLDHDRHLYDWYVREKSRYLSRRQAHYRDFAVWAARTYGTVVIAKRSYVRERRPAEEARQSEGESGRVIMRQAAPGELVALLREAAKKYGARLVEVKMDGDTAWALDKRVCEKLLASGEVVGAEASPLAAVATDGKRAKAPKKRRLGNVRREDLLAGMDVAPRDGA